MKRVLVLMGLPGSGKSSVARKLQKDHPRFTWLDTDQIRRFIFDEFYDNEGIPDPLIYDERMKTVNYQVIILLARHLLECGRDVLIEGVFNTNALREKIFYLAQDLNAFIHFIDLVVQDDVAKVRLSRRMQMDPSVRVSDADFSVYLKLKERREAPSTIIKNYYYQIDATKNLQEIVHEIKNLIDLNDRHVHLEACNDDK